MLLINTNFKFNHFQPVSNSPTAWFTFLFGRQINASTPLNPVHNIDKTIYFFQVI
jgi:hypothetical protein